MRRRRAPRIAGRRLGMCACAALALTALPSSMYPWEWFVALLLPAALAIPIGRLPFAPFERAAAVVALQVSALLAALHFGGPIHRLAALGGTLLPPLVFLALRAEPLDVLRGVFLSFCVLLIGAILGDPSNLHVLAFLAVAALTLQVDVSQSAAEDRASARTRRPAWARRATAAASVAAGCLLACLLSFHLLRALPSPSRDDRPIAPASTGSRSGSVGLSSDFDFGNVPGSILSMRGDRLVVVESADGRAVPPDLYLRCGHFDVAGLDRWGTRRAQFAALPFLAGAGIARVGRYLPSQSERRIRVEIAEPGTGFAYVPPGAFAISRAPGLLGDLRAAVFRFAPPPPPGTAYQVAFHTLHEDEVDELPDSRLAGLTEIGDDLRPWRGMFEEILERPGVRREIEPMEVARAIAAELHAQCSYALREPTGPHGHSILNFLDGNREGFCMHFASVTAICLRLSGIPARIGVGLFRGDPSEEEYGARVFGSQHAHAWVEIPFSGLGWVVFDPTPPAARENLRWIDFGAAGMEVPPDDEASDAAAELRTARFALRSLADTWPWLVVVAASALLIGLRWRRDVRVAHEPAPIPPDARTARKLLERILDGLAAQGHPRLQGESLERFAARLREDGVGGAELRDAFAAYQEIRFGGRAFDAPHRSRLERGRGAVRPA